MSHALADRIPSEDRRRHTFWSFTEHHRLIVSQAGRSIDSPGQEEAGPTGGLDYAQE